MSFNRGTNGHLEVAENIVGFLHEDKFTDVIIEARADTDEGHVYINAHQVVLASNSPQLKQVLKGLPEVIDGSKSRLLLPEFAARTVRNMLQFFYTGHFYYKSKNEKDDLLTILGAVGTRELVGKRLVETEVSEKKLRKAETIFNVSTAVFPRPKNLPFRIHQEKKSEQNNWIPTTGPKTPANRHDSSDSDVETLLDKQGEISVSRILENRPSLTIKAVGGGDDDWPCPLCPEAHGATFMSHESLVEHLKVHDGDDEDLSRANKPSVCQKCGSVFKLQIALKTHNCASVQKRKKMSDCSVVLEDCLKPGPKQRTKAAARKPRAAAAASKSFLDDSANSSLVAQRANDDESDADDPAALVSEESEEDTDSDEEIASVQKSKKKRKNKSYADEVWGDDNSSDGDSAAKKASRPTPAKKPRENKENAAETEKSGKATPAVANTNTSRTPLTASAKTPLTSSSPGSAVRRTTIANVRICILCKGEGKKGGFNNGKAIDFKNKFMESCFHYAICYYDTHQFFELFPPGDDNVDEDGKPQDEMGREILYTCNTCLPKKSVGYKAYFVHMVAVHGELQTLLEKDIERQGAQNVLDSYKAARQEEEAKGHVQPRITTGAAGGANPPKSNEPKSAKCRMSRCNFTCPPKNLEELKSHYTLRHFKAHFTEPQSAEKPPRIPVEVDTKKGLRCEMCTSKKKKEGTVGKEAVVYVKGSREDVVVHYAVEHDKLLNAMKKRATEREVIMAIGDLYGKGAEAAKKTA